MADRYTIASIAILSRFNDPNISDILSFLLPFLQLPIHLQKTFEIRVISSLGDVETQRKGIEDILIPLLVVIPHIVEECFFVADIAILREVVVEDQLT